jgi:hypothetical protein
MQFMDILHYGIKAADVIHIIWEIEESKLAANKDHKLSKAVELAEMLQHREPLRTEIADQLAVMQNLLQDLLWAPGCYGNHQQHRSEVGLYEPREHTNDKGLFPLHWANLSKETGPLWQRMRSVLWWAWSG